MNNKKILKTGIALILCIGLALVYTFAQKGKNEKKTTVVVPEMEEKNNTAADLPGTATGDDPWKEMGQLVKTYYAGGTVEYKGSMKLIDDNGDEEKIIEEHPFEYSFSNGDFHYSLDSMEFISQEKYIVAIDHRNRLISVSGVVKKNNGSSLFDMDAFKKIMLEQKATAVVTQSGNEKMLTVENIPDPQVQGYRVYYDPVTYRISKMLVGMMRLSPLGDDENYIDGEEAPVTKTELKETAPIASNEEEEGGINTYTYYIEINYTENSQSATAAKEFDPVHRVLKISKDKIELQPAFSRYELLHVSAQTE